MPPTNVIFFVRSEAAPTAAETVAADRRRRAACPPVRPFGRAG